ncbi:MAG: hypothetical protein ACI9KE_003263 [Polyangiales bacterium]|jgi:hypothetical protein
MIVAHDVPEDVGVLSVAEVVAKLVREGRPWTDARQDHEMIVATPGERPVHASAHGRSVIDVDHGGDDEDVDHASLQETREGVTVSSGHEASVLPIHRPASQLFKRYARGCKHPVGLVYLCVEPGLVHHRVSSNVRHVEAQGQDYPRRLVGREGRARRHGSKGSRERQRDKRHEETIHPRSIPLDALCSKIDVLKRCPFCSNTAQ